VADLADEPTLNDQIGTLSGDTPLSGSGSLGELTFDSAGPQSVPIDPAKAQKDPQAKLHMPVLKQNTTTSVSVSGGGAGANGGGASNSGPLAGATGGGQRAQVIAAARKLLGVPYVWGGTSASGVDCSGLVQWAFGQAGISMPRISADQARHGKRVAISDLQPGDLVAWDNSSRNNGADHIAIYIGNGMIIEAPRPGRSVQLSHLYDLSEAWGVSLSYGGGGGRPRRPKAISNTANKPHLT